MNSVREDAEMGSESPRGYLREGMRGTGRSSSHEVRRQIW